MDWDRLGPETQKGIQEVLGYLNFSSGATDPRFLRNVNDLFGRLDGCLASMAKSGATERTPTWRALGDLLRSSLDRLRSASDAFRQLDQAEAVLPLVFDDVLPAYRRHHRDLLFHQTEESLFQPLFIGRVCEAVLAQGGPWEEADRIRRACLRRLNDYLGHRPVAVLRTAQKLQPYEHEQVRPIPLYIDRVGVAVGRYHDLVAKMLEILRATGSDLLRRAWFDPDQLEELALDPRAFDFDHPVNRRPNHHFGGWDPHRIDNRGHYRRFVLQQVTLDALLSRVEACGDRPRDELLFEAAAVLAGTMLMGSAVTGDGPEAHDSSTTLATLLPHIAAYRDDFYQRLLTQMSGAHARRLSSEAQRLRQPMGGARQDLNQKLARRRAEQLQHVMLARLFAQMGYCEAATRQARIVPVASARMRSEIDNRLTAAHLAIDHGRLEEAGSLVPEIEDLLHRAIRCGAFVDPWNILGFGAQFSLFPSPENSVHDHRVDELIDLVDAIFTLCARLEKEAAAAGQDELQETLSRQLESLARWWDQYASTEVGEVRGVSGREAWESAAQVAMALGAWYGAGTAAGDIAFWREQVDQFHSPKAYALVVETLLEHGDLVASMALLMHWLSQAREVPLAEGNYSFHELAVRWMEELWQSGEGDQPRRARPVGAEKREALTRKFFDYFEVNADDFWQAPKLELEGASPPAGSSEEEEDSREDGGLFAAAYENVTFRDTADDGFEGEMLEGASRVSDFELSHEAERIGQRLALLVTLARLWKLAAAGLAAHRSRAENDQDGVLASWAGQADANYRGMLQLAAAVQRYRIPAPRGTHESLVEYDHRRAVKDALLDRIISACVEMADARRFVLAGMEGCQSAIHLEEWERPVEQALRGLFRGDDQAVRAAWPPLLRTLAGQPLLYIPTHRGGNPGRVIASRSIQRVLRRLLDYLPRLGLLTETYRLLETIQGMERKHPVGSGAITEFDRLFEIGARAIVQCLVVSSAEWDARPARGGRRRAADRNLIECMENTAEFLLKRWLAHSRTIRISVLESVTDDNHWRRLKEFIQRYGQELFTQPFMNFGNLRAILHQGVDNYLRSLEEEPEDQRPEGLLRDLDRAIPREEAVRWLELAIEAVAEHYSEYVDYNSTTTQSDRGEMLYTLLDFLRVQAAYDRVAWNLRPMVLCHQVLVRLGRTEAARTWRRGIAERTGGLAGEHQRRFEKLCRQYGMRLPSIGDRLRERFVRPLDVDCLCALVRPAVEELCRGEPPASFASLEAETARFTEEPSGVGFEVPAWLEAFQREVQRVRARTSVEDEFFDPAPPVPQVRLSREDVERQIGSWGR